MLRSADDVDDAVQNASLRMLRMIDAGYPIRSLVDLWVATARNEAASIHRANCRRLRRVALQIDDELAARTGNAPEATEIREATLSVIATSLSPAARRWLTDVLAKTPDAEIARRDGVSSAAVRQRRCRLERMVRAVLSRAESDAAWSRTDATGISADGSRSGSRFLSST